MKYLLIFLGGAIGAVTRTLISELIGKVQFLSFSVGIMFVNVLGCFLLGLVINSLDPKYQNIYQPLLLMGFLGAFTTFSAFSKETFQLIEQGNWLAVVAYVFITIIGCLLATWLGLHLNR
jgi:CrcB protein